MRLIFRIVKYIIIFAHIPEDMMLTRVNRDLFLPLTMRKCYSIFLLVTLLLDSCWLWLSFWSSFSILFLKRSSNFGVLLCLWIFNLWLGLGFGRCWDMGDWYWRLFINRLRWESLWILWNSYRFCLLCSRLLLLLLFLLQGFKLSHSLLSILLSFLSFFSQNLSLFLGFSSIPLNLSFML